MTKRYGDWKSQKLYCVCKTPNDNTRYISCDACDQWYHVRCCGIADVLPGFVTKEIASSCINFFCGQVKCPSNECYCIYRKKYGHIKFPLVLSANTDNTTDTTNSLDDDIVILDSQRVNEENGNSDGEKIGRANKIATESWAFKKSNSEEKNSKGDVDYEDIVDSGGSKNIEKDKKSRNDFNGSEIEDSPGQSDSESIHEVPRPGLDTGIETTLSKETGLRLDTLNELSNCKFPSSGIFTKTISKEFITRIDRNSWDNLMNNHLVVPKTKSKKRFQQGSWQHVMCDLIRQANPYCTVLFKRQNVYQATKRRSKTNRVFSAEGYCKHSMCGITKVHLVINQDMTVSISFNSSVITHKVGETTARPIRGVQRERMKETLNSRKYSPSVEYARRISEKDKEVFVSGNRDNIGRTTDVLKQIAYEDRSDKRLDTLELDSLLKLKHKYVMFFP